MPKGGEKTKKKTPTLPQQKKQPQALPTYAALRLQLVFVVPIALAVLLLLVVEMNPIHTTIEWYRVSAIFDICVTIIVGAIAFARYYARKNTVVLFIAIAFISAAALDGVGALHLMNIDIMPFQQRDNILIHWSWLTSQIMWSSLLLTSIGLWYLHDRYGSKAEVRAPIVYFYVGMITVAAAVFFTAFSLPEPYIDSLLLPRPYELIPATLILFGLIGYTYKKEWTTNPFDYWMIVGLFFTLCSHLLFMAHSHAIYDVNFYLAQLYNDIGLLCIAFGMLRSIANLFREYEKKEVELMERFQEIRREKAFDDAMIESLGDGLIVTDSDTRIVRVNAAFETLTGWAAADVVGEPVTKIIPMLDKEGKEVPYEERSQSLALFSGQKVNLDMDFAYQRKDGTAFPVSAVVTPIILDREILGAIELFRDVTREKLIDEQKSTFVSVASHQLRTPLTTLNWYTEMLLSGDAGKITKQQKEFLQEIYQGSKRLVLLVNDLLNVSRIESGRMRIDPQPVDVPALIKESIEEVKPLTKGRDVVIDFENKNGDFSQTPLDESLFRQVIHNLLTNAVRYSPQTKKTTVRVALERKRYSVTLRKASPIAPGEYMLLSVSDEGIGIPKDQQTKIFQKFFRAENALHAAADGSGLGLYFVKMILDEAGGVIWFTTKEGKGTTFFVAIPIRGMKKREGDKTASFVVST